MLDVGCGSGVLSVVAARMGAPYVEAIDISPAAVEATLANAERNGVAGGGLGQHAVRSPRSTGTFDVVLANLLAPVARRPGADLRRVSRPSGALIVSGILDGATRPRARRRWRRCTSSRRSTREGWAALLARH